MNKQTKDQLAKLYCRLIKYAVFMGSLGGIASFIGPHHSGLIKAEIGIVVGAMLLGKRLPDTLKKFCKTALNAAEEYTGE